MRRTPFTDAIIVFKVNNEARVNMCDISGPDYAKYDRWHAVLEPKQLETITNILNLSGIEIV